jgi:uncharacterized membrane protein YdbT with pleckstrin-like domain
MSLDKVLNANEKVLFRTRLHWLPCAPGALVLSLLAFVALASIALFGRPTMGRLLTQQPAGAWILLGVLVAVAIVPLLALRFLVRTHEFGVTDRRLVATMGWIAVRTVDLGVSKIETIVVEQGLFGRMLGYGDLKVTGTGGTSEVFHGVRDPIGFRKAVNSASDGAGQEAGS